RAREVQLDLRLDPRLEEVADREVRVAVRRVVDGRVVDVAPDRCPHAVLGPDRAVGEADLAPDGTLATRTPSRVHVPCDRVGAILVERPIAVGETPDQAAGIRRVEDGLGVSHRQLDALMLRSGRGTVPRPARVSAGRTGSRALGRPRMRSRSSHVRSLRGTFGMTW